MTDQKQAPERIWAVNFVEPQHELDAAGKYWNSHVNCGKEYIRSDLHEALTKQRDELAAEVGNTRGLVQHWKDKCDNRSERLHQTEMKLKKAEAERDEALAQSAAREIAMRDRAATVAWEHNVMGNRGYIPDDIRALQPSPDGQQALANERAREWDEGVDRLTTWLYDNTSDGGSVRLDEVLKLNPYRKSNS